MQQRPTIMNNVKMVIPVMETEFFIEQFKQQKQPTFFSIIQLQLQGCTPV